MIDRRQFLATLPWAGLAGPALAQSADEAAPVVRTSIVASGLAFPEAPLVMADGSLLFVEIAGKTICRLSPGGVVGRIARLDGGPNGLAIGPDKALYIANNGGRFSFARRGPLTVIGPPPADHVGGMIQRMDLASGRVTTLYDACDGKRLMAPDDLLFDRAGGMWITDLGKREAAGGVYYARPDGSAIRQVKGGLIGANGIGLSPDGRRLHVSTRAALMGWDIIAPGRLAANPVWPNGVESGLAPGTVGDSLKVQADGRVALCLLFAGGVGIFGAKGSLGFIRCDDPMTTNLAFGGPDMRDVWLTFSATGRIARARWPHAGLAPAYRG